MDDATAKQLIRQLKIIKIWISIFGTLIIAGLLILLFLIFKMVTFVQDTSEQLSSLQQQTQDSLNLKKQVCDNKSLTSFLGGNNSICSDE